MTVTAVYEAITAKNMTVEYRYSDGTQAAPSHVEQAVVGEPFHKTVPSPALDGFTPDKAEVVFAVESVTEDLTVVVTYSGAARNYTVKHLFQNVEGTAYAEDEALRETLEGTTGLDTAAQAKTVEGFTALPITQVKVASSGETVVEVKYDRNSYLLTWNTDGGSYIEPQMLKYGAAVSAPADPTKVGYTFAGWDSVPETMPAAATTVTAQWANATQASYQVVYWGENLTGGYDYLYADKATGAVGGNIPYSTSLTASRMPQGLEAAGFELDSAKSAGNVEITADGSAVKNVYFSRKTFTVTFYLYEKSGWFGGDWKEQSDLTISAKYGEDVSAQWNDSAHSRYMWYETSSLKTSIGGMKAMPAENLNRYGDTTRTVKIYYKTQTISGYGYDTYMEGVLPSGWTINEGDIIEIEGFTYERMNKNERTLYYTRNSYNVVFQNCTGVSQKSLKFGTSLSSAKPADSSVGRPVGMDSDYVFMGWYFDPAFQTPVDWSSTMPARNLQVYAKWAKPDYTVSFNTHGADTETPAPIGVAKYDTIEDQMPADPTREGYVFAGWYTDEAYTVPFVATQQIVRNLTLHAKWTRTDSCTYVIVAKDTEGNELKRVDGSEVEVGASVTVNAPVIDGYQAQQSSQNVKILDDGQEVVFVYDKLQNWTATVHHYIEGTTEKVAEDVIRSDLTVNSLLVYSATVSGYELAEGTSYVQTATRENSEITFYYKKIADSAYTVKHMLQDVTGDGYTEDAAARQTLHGTTGADTNAAAKSYEGFTAQAVVQQAIAADGSTVVEIKYDRNSYEVTYAYVGTAPAGASALPEKATVKYGAPVAVAAAATAPGYTFSGWSQKEDFTMPAENVTITGSFTANGDTAYTVEHYQQNLAGDGYDLVEADTEHLTGETDTTATANPKAYTGFTFDGTVEGTVASGNIAGDGSLVLKLYYTRNSYDVTYAYTGTVPADASALPEKAAVKYGASVTVAEAATAKGHTFSGWSTGDFTMPAQDVEITGSFTANPYNVTVEYYFDKVQDTDMTRVQSVTYGETFTTAAAAETDRNGVHYTLDWVENNGLTVSDIEADNVVRVYYAKDEEGGPDDIPDYAQIVFTYQSADVRKGTVDKSVEIHTFERLNGELLEEKKASPAGANAAGREGYAFDYWTDGTKRDVTSGMETLKSEVYTDNAEFTAYFDVDTKGTDPEDPDKPDNVPDKYQAKVTYQAVNGAVTLGGSMGTELVTYVTLFDADGKWAENGTGKLAEAQVPTAAAAADYDPATERWTPAVPAEGAEITADGAVFTVTWELAISGYQVHYYYDGVEDTASAVNATGKIVDAIPYDTGKTTFDGANYVLENVDGAGKLISKDAAANIVNVNFTKDEKSDPTKDPDPEVPGDNIPDKYQATVTFEAINGVLQPKGGTDAQNTKQMTTVVTLLNENGEPAENGTGYLTEAQIPTALANLGYIANTLFWGPATPTTSYAITGDITFVADFNAEGVIPEEPPVPPVTPVGPTAPEEGPEETIDEPETPLAPAEPEAPAEEPAEEEIEEADTPLASGAAWALLNLILMLCTALVSILLLIGFLGKKKKEDENENVEYTVKRKGVTRVLSLIPAIGSIIAFLLTENMRNPMVFVDRWTWLMVLIALVQVIVCIFARKEKEEPDDNAQTPAQA